MVKDKLSQTGWKLHNNFRIKSKAILDDRDRIDLFAKNGVLAQVQSSEFENDKERISDPDDCIILEY